MQRRIAIRHKAVAATMLPLVAFVAVLGLMVRDIRGETELVQQQAYLAAAADGPNGVLTSLQDERNWAAVELIGQSTQVTVAVEGYDETRQRTDQALTGFGELLAASEAQVREAYSPAMDGLVAELDAVRQRIDSNTAERNIFNADFANEIFDVYSRLIEPFFAGMTRVAGAVEDPTLRHGAELVDISARQIETIANLARTTIITSLFTEGGINEPHEISEISELLWLFRRHASLLRSETTGAYEDAASDEMLVAFTESVTDQVVASMKGGFDLVSFLAAVTIPVRDSYMGYRQQVADTLRAEATDLVEAARSEERIYLILVAPTVAVAVVIAVAVSRSITRPLRALTRQAVELAHHRLAHSIADVLRTPLGRDVTVPGLEPIVVDSRAELAEVADVLNMVQDSALELAVDQAILQHNLAEAFVNLGRRNQNLLRRQLDLITRLESDEVDPETLGRLFQLDHLATRMRRNAEGLLVLAGNSSPRRYSGPVGISDIIRAAISEVEDYQRVKVGVVEPVAIMGSAAADLAHLLAELIENALLFSRSNTTVDIRGLTHPAGYTVAVIDAGIGMSPEGIARANRRLAGAESYAVSPSNYLGHYVADKLAARHNIRVLLQTATGGGVVATVHLPVALCPFQSPGPDDATAPPSSPDEVVTIPSPSRAMRG